MIRRNLLVSTYLALTSAAYAGTIAPVPAGIEPGPKIKGAYARGQGEAVQALWPIIVQSNSRMCAAQNKPFNITGDPAQAGKYEYQSYAVGAKTVTFIEHQVIRSKDLCNMEVRGLKIITLTEWDGKRSSITEIDLEKNVGKRTWFNYRILNTGVTTSIAGSMKQMGGYKPTGAMETIAGFDCQVIQTQMPPASMEACAIMNNSKMPHLNNVVLRSLFIFNTAKPEMFTKSETVAFEPEAEIGMNVFKLPPVSKMTETK